MLTFTFYCDYSECDYGECVIIISVIIMITRPNTLFPLLYCRDFLGYGTL
jgi:hypothetical protein